MFMLQLSSRGYEASRSPALGRQGALPDVNYFHVFAAQVLPMSCSAAWDDRLAEVSKMKFCTVGRVGHSGARMNPILKFAWLLLVALVCPAATWGAVSVSLTPSVVHVLPGGKTQFTAVVSGTTNNVVLWNLTGSSCSGSGCGQITSAGLYSAPATTPTSNVITVTATSLADLTASARASVILGSSSDVKVSVSPANATVSVGLQQQFVASVSGTTITGVTWQLTGASCGTSSCGTLTANGLYTAPASVPTSPQVTVIATSVADPAISGSAVVTVAPPVAVSVSPVTARVTAGTQMQFTATVTGTTNTAVSWSLAGSGCSGAACGTISTAGLYTAPSTVPNPPQVSVTATSVADATKSGTASLTIVPSVSVTVAPSTAQVHVGEQQQFAATVKGTTNTAVSWKVSGSGCIGATCGTISTSGLYTAPSAIPSPALITVIATSAADSAKSGTASVTIVPPVSVTITPTTAQVLTGGTQQFTATVTGTSNTVVSWTVAGSGCSAAACGTISTSGLYTAPSSAPNPPQVSVTATAAADPTKSSTASVTIVSPVSVTVAPATAQVLIGRKQQFAATVIGTTNTAVTWSVAGSGCSGAACGAISASGLYTAPGSAPTPNQVIVTATSVADKTKSGSATVTLSGPISVSVSPATAQVVIGGSQQFTATGSGTSNTNVSWSVTGSGCSGSTCGTVSPNGLYFAPPAVPSPAQVFVTATSQVDPTKTATSTVTVIPPIVVTLSPATATVAVGSSQQFTATVSGSTNTAVAWSVSGTGCTGSSCGVVSSAGVYTAPATVPSPAQVYVKATSTAYTNSYRVATVTIVPLITVSVSPSSAELVVGTSQQFSATVTGTTNGQVTWSVSGKGCTGLACGGVTSTGFYIAPTKVPNPAEVTVTATSVVDTSKSGSATVTVLPPVGVTVSPASVQVVTSGSQQFTATVTGTTNESVTWSLAGSGCSGSACGTITSYGLYTAPAKIPSPARVAVRATSQADATKSGKAFATIIAPVQVTISPANAVVAVSNQLQFRATVAGSTNAAIDWSISGSACSGSTCGTITSGGLYTAPATVPQLATIVVKASAQIEVSQSASAIVNIVANQNAKMQGQYAFQFTGFDSNGVYQSTGSFTADGNGNVTEGTEDINNTDGPATDVPLTGTYQIGADNRGTLTFSSATGRRTFGFALNSADINGRFIELDDSGIRGSGILEQQDPTAFTSGALNGPYVLSLVGKDGAAKRIGALVIFDLDGAGGIAGGTMDINDGGKVPPTFASLQGNYQVAGTGRGILNLAIPGFADGGMHFSFYVISATKLLLISTDPLSSSIPIFSGPAELQIGAPYLTSSFHGPTVFSLGGETGNIAQVTVGQISFDGVAQPLVQFDQNTGGTVSTANVLTGAYSVGLNGSGTLNLDDSNGFTEVWDIYAIAPNRAYLMDVSSPEVGMGELDPQTLQAPLGSFDVAGTYVFGSGEPLVNTATLHSGVSNFDGTINLIGMEDISFASSQSVDRLLKGIYSVSRSLNDGRGVMNLTTLGPPVTTFGLWVTSQSEALAIEIDSSTTQPVVLHLEQ